MDFYEPTNGNQYFSKVIDVASSTQHASVTRIITPVLLTELVNTKFIWTTGNPTLLNKKLYSVSCFSSTSFSSLPADNAQFLNYQPNQPNTRRNNGIPVVLPPGAIIVGAYAVDNGYAGGQLDIGLTPITGGTVFPHNDDIFAGLTQANVNVGAYIVSTPPITDDSVLGGAGNTPVASPTVPSNQVTGIAVTPADDVTASTGLNVVVYFLI